MRNRLRRSMIGLLACVLPVAGIVAEAREPSTVVTARIDMRAPIGAGWFDPKTETVGLRGGSTPLSWGTTLPASDRDGDGIFEVRLTVPVRASRTAFLSHKFKVDGTDNPNDGWENGPNRPLLLSRNGAVVLRAFDAPGPSFPNTLSGPVARHPSFPSAFVTARDISVLLPAEYARSPRRRFPVVYLHDGQNLFNAAEGNGGEWRVDETALLLARRGVAEPVIVVGVYNGAERRVDDYTPTAMARDTPTGTLRFGGKADAYGRFLVEELKPFIDRTYRTEPSPDRTALGGSSLGGLVTMYLGLAYPSVYGTLLVVSPSVWWDDLMIVKRVDGLDRRTSQRIWLDTGTNEGPGTVEQARALRDALVRKGWKVGADLRFGEFAGAGHDESAWAERFGQMLQFAFPGRRAN